MAKILIIEDNEQNLYLATFILQAGTHQVLSAKDGAKGIALAVAELPDLILLDIQLPVMDGYAVAGALRTHPDLRNTPIIAITSYAMTGDKERSLKAGCDGHIEKPINPETFLNEVDQFLNLGSSPQEDPPTRQE